MSQRLENQVAAMLSATEARQDQALAELQSQYEAESDPYNQLVALTVEEARGFKNKMIAWNAYQQRSTAIGRFILPRNYPKLTETIPETTEIGISNTLIIETPLIGSYELEGLRYGWTIALNHDSDFEDFYTHQDADYDRSAVYIKHAAFSLEQPDSIANELWYTIYFRKNNPLIVSKGPAGDTEREDREARASEAYKSASAEIERDYPELKIIEDKYFGEMSHYGFGDKDFAHRIGIASVMRRAKDKYDRTEAGKERLARFEELKKREKAEADLYGPVNRAGYEAVYNCLGLLRLAAQELTV